MAGTSLGRRWRRARLGSDWRAPRREARREPGPRNDIGAVTRAMRALAGRPTRNAHDRRPAAAAHRCRHHPVRVRAAQRARRRVPGCLPMQRIARDPAVDRGARDRVQRDRLPREHRARGARRRAAPARRRPDPRRARPRARDGAAASTSRTPAPTATGSATACARPATATPATAGARARTSAGAPASARRPTRSSTPGSTAPATGASCSPRSTRRSASASRRARRSRRTPSLPGATYAMDLGTIRARIDCAGMTATAPSGARYGVTSMVAPLKRVLVRRPALAGDWDGAGWRTPDPAALERQHEAFVELLDGLGAEVEVADALDGQVDAVYMHDPLIVSGRGGIPLNMAKPARMREPGHAAEALEAVDVPVIGTLDRRRLRRRRRPLLARRHHRADRPRLPDQPQGRGAASRSCWSPRASTSRPTTCRTTRAPPTSCTCSRS